MDFQDQKRVNIKINSLIPNNTNVRNSYDDSMMLSQSNINTFEPMYYPNAKKYASSNSEGTLYQNKANITKNSKNKIDQTTIEQEMDINLFAESPYKKDSSRNNKQGLQSIPENGFGKD